MAADKNASVVVIGAGPAGLTTAIALAQAGVHTALAGRRPTAPDNRTTALLSGSVTALETLGVRLASSTHAAPLRVMRLVDDTRRLIRAPEVRFDAAEIGLEAFGYNIENTHLIAALDEKARTLPTLDVVDAKVVAVDTRAQEVSVRLDDGRSIVARIIVGADGRQSLCRNAASIGVVERRYQQSALTVSFDHKHPHHDTSTEFHTTSGPFTQVPLPGDRSSLVWVLPPDAVGHIAALEDDALSVEIERGLHSILGKIRVQPGRAIFPLSVAMAQRLGANRTALVGEAAHVVPPIGAQGLNLGLRDAATIAELVIDCLRAGGDPGAENILTQYENSRRADVNSRMLAVDLLNRSLLSDFLPLQGARGLGLYMIDRIGPLRRAAMREGTAPRLQPRLMRGEPV
ncbi:MAG: UbiH/UbiF family hydroxylase [Pseudolabrys sp.]|nr:UbiH/UbiF family hydroxylase [Pseudolabrys sp.]